MAKVMVKVQGGEPQMVEGSTVQDIAEKLGQNNYTASIDGEEVGPSTYVEEGNFVVFSKKAKAGAQSITRGGPPSQERPSRFN